MRGLAGGGEGRKRGAAAEFLAVAVLAATWLPAGCDVYDDVVLFDRPWAYWRLVPPRDDNKEVVADSSARLGRYFCICVCVWKKRGGGGAELMWGGSARVV